MSKYHNRKTVVDGIVFASQREAERYKELLLMQRAGVIEGLRLQVPFVLIPKSAHGAAIRYIADFTYREGTETVIEDAKGYRTREYRLKKRLMAERGYQIREV